MPIRFRCRYCNQLMGIARRKAGMVVHCPTCHGQVVVPQPDSVEQPEFHPSEPSGEPAAPVFERSDFEAFLQDPIKEALPLDATNPPVPQPQPLEPPSSSPHETECTPSPPLSLTENALKRRPVGLLLSPTQATWLTVVAILLLALAFGAGLLVGHYWTG
jgi:hypothetical protein